MKRLLMTGVRYAGQSGFQFKIFGNSESQFPPMMLEMPIVELQRFLRDNCRVPAPARMKASRDR